MDTNGVSYWNCLVCKTNDQLLFYNLILFQENTNNTNDVLYACLSILISILISFSSLQFNVLIVLEKKC